MRISDQIIDLARAAGYEGIAAIEAASDALKSFKESGRDSVTYTIGTGRTAQSFTLSRKSA